MSLLLCTRSPRRTNKVFFNENTNRAWDNKRVLEREREPMLELMVNCTICDNFICLYIYNVS